MRNTVVLIGCCRAADLRIGLGTDVDFYKQGRVDVPDAIPE